MTLFLTRTDKSIFLCDVTTQSRTANGTGINSTSLLGVPLVMLRNIIREPVKGLIFLSKKLNPLKFEGFKKSFKNLYVKSHTKQNRVVKPCLQYKCKNPISVLHNLSELSRVFSCFGRITKNGHITLPIKG